MCCRNVGQSKNVPNSFLQKALYLINVSSKSTVNIVHEQLKGLNLRPCHVVHP